MRSTSLVAGRRQRRRLAIGRGAPWCGSSPAGILNSVQQAPIVGRVAVTRADRRGAPSGRATRPSRALIPVLIAGMALLVIALVSSGSHSSAPQVQRPADLVVAHLS